MWWTVFCLAAKGCGVRSASVIGHALDLWLPLPHIIHSSPTHSIYMFYFTLSCLFTPHKLNKACWAFSLDIYIYKCQWRYQRCIPHTYLFVFYCWNIYSLIFPNIFHLFHLSNVEYLVIVCFWESDKKYWALVSECHLILIYLLENKTHTQLTILWHYTDWNVSWAAAGVSCDQCFCATLSTMCC